MKEQKRSLIEKILMGIGALTILVVILIAILIAVLAIKKPYGIDALKIAPALIQKDKTPSSGYDHPLLNAEQEGFLESVGIKLEDVPTEVTPTQQDCAKKILGDKRVAEIKAGSNPSITEVLKVKSCFE